MNTKTSQHRAPTTGGEGKNGIDVRPLREEDIPEADRIMRVAFGTFVGLPDPAEFSGDASWVGTRWKTDPGAAFAAEMDGEVVGSNFAAGWGSFAFFGPLSIRPDLWDRGIGKRLMEPVMSLFSEWGVRLSGLFTFPNSPKHIGMYQRYGFRPRYLTALMGKAVGPAAPKLPWARYSRLNGEEKASFLRDCREIADSVYEGLDVSVEIRSVDAQILGDTILLRDDSEPVGFAVCHHGPRTEAGSGRCQVKFAAIRPGKHSSRYFDELLSACEAFAGGENVPLVMAGVNTSRDGAYRRMLERGFRTEFLGIAMHRPNEAGFSRPGVYVLDDWR